LFCAWCFGMDDDNDDAVVVSVVKLIVVLLPESRCFVHLAVVHHQEHTKKKPRRDKETDRGGEKKLQELSLVRALRTPMEPHLKKTARSLETPAALTHIGKLSLLSYLFTTRKKLSCGP
jgi:hypothetical protein